MSERTYQPHLLADLLEQQQARIIARAVDDATADLQAECARLAAERDAAMQAVLDGGSVPYPLYRRAVQRAWGYRRERNQQQAAIYRLINRSTAALIAESRKTVAAETERDAALAALAKYGRHEEECHYWELGAAGRRRCTCGLSAALDTAPQPRQGTLTPLEGET